MTATVDDAVADLRRANAELQRQLNERTAERDEASEYQAATSDVLKVISQSGGELGSVLEARRSDRRGSGCGKSQQWLRYPTMPHVRFCAGGA
jgi:hypothetical protein